MKILTLLFILLLTLCSSKQPKHEWSASDSEEGSNDDASRTSKESNSDESNSVGSNSNLTRSNKPPTFNLKGTLRKTFAIECIYALISSNVVCSPVSALLPLGKLALGSEGRAKTELFEAVGVPGMTIALQQSFMDLIQKLQYLPGVDLSIASRIYVSDEKHLHSKFIHESKKVFQSGLEKIPFRKPHQAAAEINRWVLRQTKGMIASLVSPKDISASASLILVNAIYFKGKWLKPFRKIGVGAFYTSLDVKRAMYMSRSDYYFAGKSDALKAQVISIPYEGEKSSFIIVLPYDRDGLPLMLSQIKEKPKLLNDALRGMEREYVTLTIPKFTIETKLDLKDLYKKIDIRQIFERKSGLTRIVKNEEVSISKGIHKAVIEVHERGTEAAAASALEVMKLSLNLNPVLFHADHPFLFYVQAEEEQLFAGIFNL